MGDNSSRYVPAYFPPHGYYFSGKRFREIRRMRKKSLEQLATDMWRFERVRVTLMEISRWERGKYGPRFDELTAAVAQLNCTIYQVTEPKPRSRVSGEVAALMKRHSEREGALLQALKDKHRGR